MECKERVKLSSFRGSTIRGALMSSLYKIICMNQNNDDCHSCPVKGDCVFALLFKSFPPEEAEVLKSLDNIPRPYAIYIPRDQGNDFKLGDKITFELTLIGKNTDYIGHIIMALKRLEEDGLGRGRGKIKLTAVRSKGNNIYSKESQNIDKKTPIIRGNKFNEQKEINYINIYFLSPMRFKYEGKYCRTIKFHHIIRNLLRRYSTFARFYCGINPNWDYKSIISEAEKVKFLRGKFEWQEKIRYSKTQNQHLKIGGVVGKAEYEGNITPYLPLLRLGEKIQVGKNTTFGYGKYELKV